MGQKYAALLATQSHVARMWPIAAVNAITLSTGNYAYLYLSVSIIQVMYMELGAVQLQTLVDTLC
eukprot:232971-Amphidinium_carterae.1